MFCEKCGAKNDSSSKFCEKCGAKLDNEVKETKKNTAKKTTSKAKQKEAEQKTPTLTKKQKLIGVIVLAVVVICVILYKVGEKMTGVEAIASKSFEQLSSKKTISDKYLSVPLDSEGYFVSLEDQIKNTLDEEEISLKYNTYDVRSSGRKAVIVYRDKNDKEKYKLTFTFEKNGKTMLFYDKYVIEKITIENSGDRSEKKLYDPNNVEKITIKTLKGTKLSLDGKKIKSNYLDKKKSDDEKDVYVIKGVSTGTYKLDYSLGKLKFERKISVYSVGKNDYDITDYISSSYLKEDNSEYSKIFKKYITKYYEYVNDETKSVDDFSKEYKVTDDIKSTFNRSKEDNYYTSIRIGDVEMRSLYYNSYDNELTVSYKVNYTYTTTYTESERETYDSVRVTYNLDNLELPTSLSYMPY